MSISLSVAISNANFSIPRGIRLLWQGPLQRHTDIHQLCTFFRQRGVASLLLEGTPERYHTNSMQSAAAFLYELRRASEDSKVTSFARPLFDAVSSGYWDCAIEIARDSRASWNPDHEYEDDFQYVRFWMLYGLLDAPSHEIEAVLTRYEQVLEGAPDTRLDICRALFEHDETAFDASLRQFLQNRRAEVDDMVRRSVMLGETAAWLQHFSLEGVALLKLAERHGMTAVATYLHCPDILKPDSPFVFNPGAWTNPDFAPLRR